MKISEFLANKWRTKQTVIDYLLLLDELSDEISALEFVSSVKLPLVLG